jgi:hypothetical protein
LADARSARTIVVMVDMTMMAALGVPPPLLWSHGTRPIPEEDASAATVLAGGGGWDGPPVHHSPEGWAWKGWL